MIDREEESDPARLPTRREDPEGRALGSSFKAFAEAMRAQAEALQKLDATQRKIADTIEKSEKAQNVVASTRALNETFRGLGEIQRGLLDAVVKDRGRGRGLPFAFAAIAILAAMLGFLLYQRWTGEETVGRDVYRDARGRADELATEVAALRVRDSEGSHARSDLQRRLSEAESAAADLRRELETLRQEKARRDSEAKETEARLAHFVEVKDRADRVPGMEIENAEMRGRLRDLQDRLDRSEKERESLAALLFEERLEARNTASAEKLLAAAKERGLIPAEEKEAPAAGEVTLSPSQKKAVLRRVNRLLQKATGNETYQLLDVGAVAEGTRLRGVELGRYEGARMLNTLRCEEMEVHADPVKDTVELRLRKGSITNLNGPGEAVPFPDDAHSVFLRDVGLKEWLEQVAGGAELRGDGRLTWPTGNP